MPEPATLISIVLTALLAIVGGAFGWFIKQFVKDRDGALKQVQDTIVEIKSDVDTMEQEIYQNMTTMEQRIDERHVTSATLQLMLGPLAETMQDIRQEVRDVMTLKQQQIEQMRQLNTIAVELKEMRKDYHENQKHYAPALEWAKRMSERTENL